MVTGATGFIGAALCGRLRRLGLDVTATARREPLGSGPWREFVSCDLSRDATRLEPFLTGCSTIFHVAGLAHGSGRSIDEYSAVNVGGTQRLLEIAAACGVERLVFVSSVKAAGPPGFHQVDESHCSPPESPYGRSKREAEDLLLVAGVVGPPSVVILRPALVYGPGVKGNLRTLYRAVERGWCPRIGIDYNRRSMVSVDDLVEAAVRAASTDASGIFLITDGEAYSTERVYLAVCTTLGRRPSRVTVPSWSIASLLSAGRRGLSLGLPLERPVDALTRLTEWAWYDSSRAEAYLDWKPKVRFEDSTF
ncbi:MAG: hypothetical protein QOJ52_3721 [Acidimicrobiaceae bacterium]|jgi:nucleoside-diphosphate-sugar epimerase|nr:hypothetical protein [Acidimicrobiaceae bacterium]